jgi:hypothetical protein
MAKKRKSTKRRSTRRRRIGAVALNPANPVVKIGAAAAGFVFAGTINPLIDKVAGTMDAKLVGAGQTGIGAALMFMKLGNKKPGLVQTVAGGVLAGAGAKRLLQALGIINGFSAVPVIGRKMMKSSMNGYGNVPVIGNAPGYTVPRSLNGVFNGYTVPQAPGKMMGNVEGSGLLNSNSLMG